MEQNQNGQQNKTESMMSKTKTFFSSMTKTQIGIIIGIVVIIIVILLVAGHKSQAPVVEDKTPLVNTEDTAMTPPARIITQPKVTPPVVATAPTMTYDQAVKAYGERRVQFAQNCQASPTQPTFKGGTEIMLDNRSSETKTLAFDATTYTIPAYGFQIVTLSAETLPHTIMVDCNGSQNVTSILVQK